MSEEIRQGRPPPDGAVSRWLGMVRSSHEVRPAARRVLEAIALMAEGDQVELNTSKIARDLDLDRRGIARHVKRASELGWLELLADEPGQPKRYRLVPPDDDDGEVSEALADFRARVERHRAPLARRGQPTSHELVPPTGQAAEWYALVLDYCPPRSGRIVGRQIARLCGVDSRVTTTWRSLADAVGIGDKLGRVRAYTERGAEVLSEYGWLDIENEPGSWGTTFLLQIGDESPWLENIGTEWDEPLDLLELGSSVTPLDLGEIGAA